MTTPLSHFRLPGRRVRFACVALLSTTLAAADDVAIELEPFSVVGSRLEGLGPGATSLVDQAVAAGSDLRQVATIGEFLNRSAGIFYNESPGGAASSELWVRGGETNFTLVMLDGVKVNDVLDDRGGTFDPGLFSPALISSIVVQRGPGSALIGSGALSGSIVLETIDPMAVTGGVARLALASAGNHSGEVRLHLVEGGWQLRTDGGVREWKWPEEQGGRRTEQAGIGIAGELSDNLDIRFSARRIRRKAEGFPADSGGFEFAEIRELETSDSEATITSLRLRYQAEKDHRWQLKAYGFAQDAGIDSPGVAPGIRDPAGLPATTSESKFRRYGVAFDYAFSLGEDWDLALGAEIEREEGDTVSTYDFGGFVLPTDDRIDRTTHSLAFEARRHLAHWVFTYAARADHADAVDTEISQQLRIDWLAPIEGVAIGFSAQNGFKFPSLYALSNAFVGNRDLNSERATAIAGHLRWAPVRRPWIFEATVFAAQYRDLIDFDPGPPPRLVNRDRVQSFGFDLRTEWQVGRFVTSGYLSLASTNLVGSADRLLDRPEWRGGVEAEWNLSHAWALHLRSRYVGRILDSSIATGERFLKDYVVVDLLASWKISDKSDLSLRLENIFDTRYHHAIGSPARGLTPSAIFSQEF